MQVNMQKYTETHMGRDAWAMRKMLIHAIRLRKRASKQRDPQVHSLCDCFEDMYSCNAYFKSQI